MSELLTETDIEFMRESQEALMLDTVAIDRLSSRWDEKTQKTVKESSQMYQGKARLAVEQGAPVVLQDGETAAPQVSYLTVPVGTPVQPGDRVTVLSSEGEGAVYWVATIEKPAFTHSALRCSVTSRQAAA